MKCQAYETKRTKQAQGYRDYPPAVRCELAEACAIVGARKDAVRAECSLLGVLEVVFWGFATKNQAPGPLGWMLLRSDFSRDSNS